MWHSYEQGRDQQILAAEPIELVVMLYQGAIESVQRARMHLRTGNILERGRAINKCTAILIELAVSLNHDAATELAQRLSDLYAYLQRRLLEGHAGQLDAPLADVESVLATLLSGWQQCQTQLWHPAAVAVPSGPVHCHF